MALLHRNIENTIASTANTIRHDAKTFRCHQSPVQRHIQVFISIATIFIVIALIIHYTSQKSLIIMHGIDENAGMPTIGGTSELSLLFIIRIW